MEERAEKGANFLDVCIPEWETRVNTKSLLMQHCDMCILGQLYGDYVLGCNAFNFAYIGEEARSLGFCLPKNEVDEYPKLTTAWKNEITKRLEARGMDIGTEQPAIVVEPVEDPFKKDQPVEDPTPVLVPAKRETVEV